MKLTTSSIEDLRLSMVSIENLCGKVEIKGNNAQELFSWLYNSHGRHLQPSNIIKLIAIIKQLEEKLEKSEANRRLYESKTDKLMGDYAAKRDYASALEAKVKELEGKLKESHKAQEGYLEKADKYQREIKRLNESYASSVPRCVALEGKVKDLEHKNRNLEASVKAASVTRSFNEGLIDELQKRAQTRAQEDSESFDRSASYKIMNSLRAGLLLFPVLSSHDFIREMVSTVDINSVDKVASIVLQTFQKSFEYCQGLLNEKNKELDEAWAEVNEESENGDRSELLKRLKKLESDLEESLKANLTLKESHLKEVERMGYKNLSLEASIKILEEEAQKISELREVLNSFAPGTRLLLIKEKP